MVTDSVATAHQLLTKGMEALRAAGDTDDDILDLLRVSQTIGRQLTAFDVTTLGELQRRGTFTERGYTSTTNALGDMLGMQRSDARLRIVAAEQVCPRVG